MDNTSHNKKTLSIIPPSLDMFDHLGARLGGVRAGHHLVTGCAGDIEL